MKFSKNYSKKRTFPYAIDDVFRVVTNVEDYPNFLTGCSDVKILKNISEHKKIVDVSIGAKKVNLNYMCYVEIFPSSYEVKVTNYDHKIFQSLVTHWKLNAENRYTTHVRFDIDFTVKNIIFSKMLDSMFSYMTDKTLNSFVVRLHDLYDTTNNEPIR